MSSTSCHCEPTNSGICFNSTTCSLNRGLNGNHLVEVERELPVRTDAVSQHCWNPSVSFRISHVAGFPAAFCDRSINGVILCLTCGTFLYPFLLLLWTCCAIETTVRLWKNGASVDGTILRRSACCSWRTSVTSVTKVESENLPEDSEGAPRVYIHFSAGAAKAEISEGPVPGLESEVKSWLQQQ